MCGIAGVIDLAGTEIPDLGARLQVMDDLIAHRGPDGTASWVHDRGNVGLTHRRLAIIDLISGAQPMRDGAGNWVIHNGEIYNYIELREELGIDSFRTTSDTEVILRAYERWGEDCVNHFRGMFAFALWDESRQRLFAARDRFGMKPFYYAIVEGRLIFASEAKAILPFLPDIRTDLNGFKDYLTFQFCLDGKTLFEGVKELLPGHVLTVASGTVSTRRYWDVYFEVDFTHTSAYFEERLRELLADSVRLHLRADVPVGAYLSGGLDSSIVTWLAAREVPDILAFTGKFSVGPEFDESGYARDLAGEAGIDLREIDITVGDFESELRKVIYHLDYPAAGPGSFPQFMVSRLARAERKVVLGGQGGDELFGGYARYLIAYFEQCLKAAIDGTMGSGNFIVSYESILPNLTALRQYKPLLQEFWREGLFESMDRRYFRLVSRAPALMAHVNWSELGDYSPFETFQGVFNVENVPAASYFDRMTHFDFKTLLPALLQIEDRMSMAHGLESRLPFLDHPLVELAATIPADIKFEGGNLKRVLKAAFRGTIPRSILERQDKMGFPTPLTRWSKHEARSFVTDVLSTPAAMSRDLIDTRGVLAALDTEPEFGRNLWAVLSLELWQQEFHDKAASYRTRLRDAQVTAS